MLRIPVLSWKQPKGKKWGDVVNRYVVYRFEKGERIDLNDPRQSLNQEELFSPGVGFMVKQNKYDALGWYKEASEQGSKEARNLKPVA